MHKSVWASAAASMTCLVACAGPGVTPVPGPAPGGSVTEMRVLVKLVKVSSDPQAIAALVGAAAGTRARYLSATSPQWHALALNCAGPEACDAALRRLAARSDEVEAVQRDERKRIVTP